MNSTTTISTLRPGLLVSLKSAVTGNVSYEKQDIEAETRLPDGSLRAQWETTKRVEDAAEHEVAIKTRSKCRSLITGICSKSNFGLLCPEEKAGLLWDRYTEALDLAAEFNSTSRLTKIEVYIIAGRVAQDDVSAVRAINSEVRDLLTLMEDGLKRLDVEAVRDAANRAKSLGSMLSADAKSRVEEAIGAARSAARRIVKAAEEGVAEIDQATLTKIRQSRAGFIDLEGGEVEVAEPEHTGRAIDLTPEEPPRPLVVEAPALTRAGRPVNVKPMEIEPLDDAEVEARARAIERRLGLDTEVDAVEQAFRAENEDALRRGGNSLAEHSPLCDCPACSAEFGDTVTVPKPAVRSIELD